MTSTFITGASRRDVLRTAAASMAALSMGSYAQSGWPAKPVTMIVPFPAGGGTDAFARPLSAQFSRLTGKHTGRGYCRARTARRLHAVHGCGAPHHRAQHVSQTGLRP